jgi:hypothetical protein
MDEQAIIVDRPIESEVILDEEDTEEEFSDSDTEPWDLADRIYEEWRDRKLMKDEPEQ